MGDGCCLLLLWTPDRGTLTPPASRAQECATWKSKLKNIMTNDKERLLKKIQGFLHFPFHEASQITCGSWLTLNSGVTWENLRAHARPAASASPCSQDPLWFPVHFESEMHGPSEGFQMWPIICMLQKSFQRLRFSQVWDTQVHRHVSQPCLMIRITRFSFSILSKGPREYTHLTYTADDPSDP